MTEDYIVNYKKISDTGFVSLTASHIQFCKALRHLQISSTDIDSAVTKIVNAGLDIKAAQHILSVVMHYDNPINFFKAIDNPMPVKDFLSSTNLVDTVVKRYQLHPELVANLFQFASLSQPVTGKGETFICLFVKGARKGKAGDIEINGKRFEIKGSSARLVGFNSGCYGSQTIAADQFTFELRSLAKKANIDIRTVPLNYVLTPNDYGVINDIAPALTSTGKVTKNDIVKVYSNGFRKIYKRATDFSWLKHSLNSDGVITEKFFLNYFTFALKYYATMENFDYLVSIGTSNNPKVLFGKLSYLSKQDIVDESNLTAKIIPDAWPRFAASAGTQGAFFAIRPAY